ncbi:hypothetical protein [Puerhibacterium puerhi]|uniref:hypothetical protein n=1 Tax=Puerhibacterium puerhi TaxID=2692623 RepID=UPI001357FDAA|nr:hypothetical protein [Puerhibacterium puerhi]
MSVSSRATAVVVDLGSLRTVSPPPRPTPGAAPEPRCRRQRAVAAAHRLAEVAR